MEPSKIENASENETSPFRPFVLDHGVERLDPFSGFLGVAVGRFGDLNAHSGLLRSGIAALGSKRSIKGHIAGGWRADSYKLGDSVFLAEWVGAPDMPGGGPPSDLVHTAEATRRREI